MKQNVQPPEVNGLHLLIGQLLHRKPDFSVPPPPPDNRRMRVATYIDETGKRKQRYVLSSRAARYLRAMRPLKAFVPDPPLYLVYKGYFANARRDPHNITKLLLDALFDEDKEVYPICLAPEINRNNPRIDIWWIKP